MRDEDTHVPPRWAVAWFTTLIAVSVAVRVVDPTGWLGSDDASYYSAAEHVLTGQPIQRLHHHYARAAVVLPVAASVAVFGHSAAAVALPMFLASVLCIALVVLLGRLLLGWWEGLCAASVVSVLPYFRVLSTTAFPDVHVCLWTTAAMIAAVYASRTSTRRTARWLWATCGFLVAAAVSAKLFACTVIAGIVWIPWKSKPNVAPPLVGGARLSAAIAFVAGAIAFQLAEGYFYLWAAGDFFFSLHATLVAQTVVAGMALESGAAKMTLVELVWDRLAMLSHPTTSGWGWVGVVFWPTMAFAAAWNKAARPLVAWALATYLLIAFMPLSLKDGGQLNPLFHGRHILPACIPFALCLGWLLRRSVERIMQPNWAARSWPAVLAGVTCLAFANSHQLNGFRDRPTSRVGEAIRQLVQTSSWTPGRGIFMTPSLYWRFRVLFPADLRDRLRVATDEAAPSWWKDVCPDIAARLEPLPSPDQAYLIATPMQLRGELEQWDYGVPLPAADLAPWRASPAAVVLVRDSDHRIGPRRADVPGGETILLLVGGDPPAPAHLAAAP